MHYQGYIENAARDVLTNLPVAPVEWAPHDAAGLAELREIWAVLPPIPKIVANRASGVDRSWPGFDVKTLLAGEESAGRFSCHSIVVSPGAAFPRHSLADADTVCVLLSGSLEITVGAVTRSLSKGAFAFAPKGASQAFANRSHGKAELLLLHTPAGVERAFDAVRRLYRDQPAAGEEALRAALTPFGFDFSAGPRAADARSDAAVSRILRDIRTPKDFADLRAAWTRLAPAPKLLARKEDARFLPVPGQATWVLLEPEESAGIASAFANHVAKGFCAPRHHQPEEEELFFVLDGELELTIGNQVVQAAGPGSFAFAPRFATHAFANTTEKTAQLYTFNSPGGHDRGFEYAADHPGAADVLERVAAMGFHFHPANQPA